MLVILARAIIDLREASGAVKYGSRAGVLSRSEGTCFWFQNDDEVGGPHPAIRTE
jgi:hypothetical protein